MKIKKGDTVLVTAGKDKGKKGKVEKVIEKKEKVVIAGVNVFRRHRKSQGQGRKGEIIDIVRPLNTSNIALICPKCGKQTRAGFDINKKGVKIRICKKCRKEI